MEQCADRVPLGGYRPQPDIIRGGKIGKKDHFKSKTKQKGNKEFDIFYDITRSS